MCALVSLLTPGLPRLWRASLMSPLCAHPAPEQQDLNAARVLQAPPEHRLLIITEKINVLRVFFSLGVHSFGTTC